MTAREIESIRKNFGYNLNNFIDNLLEKSSDNSISKLSESLEVKLVNKTNEYLDFISQPENIDENYLLDKEGLDIELLALTEMKIIYLYKNFEINLKKVINANYGVATRNFYKVNELNIFLKLKGIDYNKLDGYKDVEDLRKVNNFVKHSVSCTCDELKGICEFKGLKNFMEFEVLNIFYNRIKDAPNKLIIALSDEIYKDICVFDEVRLDEMAILYAQRMDKSTAQKFIKLLNEKYMI